MSELMQQDISVVNLRGWLWLLMHLALSRRHSNSILTQNLVFEFETKKVRLFPDQKLELNVLGTNENKLHSFNSEFDEKADDTMKIV